IPRARPGLGRYQAGCSRLEQIKERKDKNPDKIDKVPEESADFDTVGQMLRIALIKSFADWQPHINKNQNAREHVRAVQTGNGKITGEVGAVPWAKGIDALDIFLLDVSDVIGRRNVEKMRTIVRRIIGIDVNRIEADLVLLDARVLDRLGVVQMTTDLDSRLHPFFGPAIVTE